MKRIYSAAKADLYHVPAETVMNMGKLHDGHVTSDNFPTDCATTDQFVAYITRAAQELHKQESADQWARGVSWVEEKEVNIIVHIQRCWNHIQNTWIGNVMKACNKHMTATFAQEVKAMKEACPGEAFLIDIVNLIHCCGKYICQKAHDAKGDQVDFHT